ncbi:MAG TPA: hypothetical protein VGS20_01825 [Candidatus Acidoferrales bacterium]|nr:hypothetical protein [Candidatus Acidoferrales bacterium]
MNQMATVESFLGVNCIRCKQPVPVPAQAGSLSPSGLSTSGPESVPGPNAVFLAWCPTCSREAPYLTSEIVAFTGPAPSSHFQPHPPLPAAKTAGTY